MSKTTKTTHQLGDKVMLPLRADGVTHIDGNDAVWEIISIHAASGSCTLHLVGADADSTCGAVTKALRPANV